MFCYVINYISWLVGAFCCSAIKCFAFEPKKKEKKIWKYILTLFLIQLPVVTIKFVNANVVWFSNVCFMVLVIMYIAYMKRMFECYLWQAVLLIVLEVCCSFMAEIIMQQILHDELSKYNQFTLDMPIMVWYVIGLYTIMPILYLFVLFLFKRFVLKVSFDLKVFYMFSIFPISQMIMLFTVNKNLFADLTPNGIIAFVGIIAGGVADVILLITLLKQQRMQELAIKITEMEKTWEIEQNHYHDIEARREDLAKIRHDLSQQFLVIQELLHQEKYEKAQEMLGILRDDVTETKECTYCADAVVNAILAENEKSCLKSDIRFDYDIQIMQPLKLNPVVICSLFSNLLRNAIAAARETEEGTMAYVSVKSAIKGDYLHIKVENSYNDKQKKKTNRKGYGLSILKTIADEYSGQMEQFASDAKYSVHIVVENIEKNEMNPSLM